MSDWDLSFGKDDIPNNNKGFKPLPEGNYLFRVLESTVKSFYDEDQWSIAFVIPEHLKYGNRRIFVNPSLERKDMRWLVVKMYEGIFGVPWPEEGLTKEEFYEAVQQAQGALVQAYVSIKTHWNAEKAAAGELINQIDKLSPAKEDDATPNYSKTNHTGSEAVSMSGTKVI